MLRKIILSIFSGVLLSLPYFDGRLWILGWCGFLPLFIVLSDKAIKQAFLLSYLTGIVFWALTIYWLVHVTLLGQIILILYLALYFGIFGFIFLFRISRHGGQAHSAFRVIFISSFWVILEYIRSHLFTGFGWALLGYSQYLNLPVIQIADVFGVWGVSFLVMTGNLLVYEVINHKKNAKIFIGISVIVIALMYGYYRLSRTTDDGRRTTVKISLIQGNIPQELKWAPGAQDFILNRYIELTKAAALDKPDLIVWPEASSPGFLGQDEEIFKRIFALSAEIKIPFLLGSVVVDGGEYFNSALLLENGAPVNRYDKLHLVPFGEYIPLKKVLPFLETVVPIGDFNAGREYVLFGLRNGIENKFAVLICFEDTIPQISRNFVNKGADFLINITNDGWYKETSAPYQHLSASVFRAVENRVPLVRAANTGVSAFIDTRGRITARVWEEGKDVFVKGFKTWEIVLDARK